MEDLVVHPSPDPPSRTLVRLGRGALSSLGELSLAAPVVLLVADEALAGTALLSRAEAALAGGGRPAVRHLLHAREDEKSLDACARLWDAWIDAGASRDAMVVALGGGLTSDVAGFAAACFHRGIPWILAPTTTLSMADAALGGKTAVNARAGKNMVGVVHHPLAVLADLDALQTLPPSAFAEGFAEVVKSAIVGDALLLDAVEAAGPALRALDADVAGPLLLRALRVKAAVVEADAREASRREILNFGHTLAHAIEHATGHAVSHGRAVAAGLVAESLLAESLGRLPRGTARRAAAACEAAGLPWRLDATPDRDALVAAMRRDKKSRAGVVRAALPEDLGRHSDAPGVAVDPGELAALLGQEP